MHCSSQAEYSISPISDDASDKVIAVAAASSTTDFVATNQCAQRPLRTEVGFPIVFANICDELVEFSNARDIVLPPVVAENVIALFAMNSRCSGNG